MLGVSLLVYSPIVRELVPANWMQLFRPVLQRDRWPTGFGLLASQSAVSYGASLLLGTRKDTLSCKRPSPSSNRLIS
jgi:hypothetical protein